MRISEKKIFRDSDYLIDTGRTYMEGLPNFRKNLYGKSSEIYKKKLGHGLQLFFSLWSSIDNLER